MSLVRLKEITDLDSEEAKVKAEAATTDGKAPAKSKIPTENAGVGDALQPLVASNLNMTLAPVNDLALKGWPWEGDLLMRNVSMRYNEASPLVLKEISLKVPSGTTLGVVGRSGSGTWPFS